MLFRLWESVNSYMFDERMLHFLAQLAEMHVDPSISDPKRSEEVPDDVRSENEGRPNWNKDDLNSSGLWGGIFKDVGIFTDYDWHFVMCKCLASMGWCFSLFPSNMDVIKRAHAQKFHWQTRDLLPRDHLRIIRRVSRSDAFPSQPGELVSQF